MFSRDTSAPPCSNETREECDFARSELDEACGEGNLISVGNLVCATAMNTSLHGVCRIFSTKRISVKLFWAFIVMASFNLIINYQMKKCINLINLIAVGGGGLGVGGWGGVGVGVGGWGVLLLFVCSCAKSLVVFFILVGNGGLWECGN